MANLTAVVPDVSLYVGMIFYTISPNDYLEINRCRTLNKNMSTRKKTGYIYTN